MNRDGMETWNRGSNTLLKSDLILGIGEWLSVKEKAWDWESSGFNPNSKKEILLPEDSQI